MLPMGGINRGVRMTWADMFLTGTSAAMCNNQKREIRVRLLNNQVRMAWVKVRAVRMLRR